MRELFVVLFGAWGDPTVSFLERLISDLAQKKGGSLINRTGGGAVVVAL